MNDPLRSLRTTFAADLAQDLSDQHKAAMQAAVRKAGLGQTVSDFVRDQGKALEELEADALVAIKAERAKSEAKKSTQARMAAARAAGAQEALAELSAPAATAPQPAPAPRKRTYRREGWQQTPAFDYVVSVYVSTKSITWKELDKALRDRATDETPVGLLNGRFFIRDLRKTVEGKTISYALPAIREAAAKLTRNPHFPAKHLRE